VADRALTGVLLVGGASRRFGSPKALARLDGETLAERGWRILGETCDEVIALGKRADGLELPFSLVDDDSDVRAPLAGLVSALRVARHELCVVVPVDAAAIEPEDLRALAAGAAGADAGVPQTGPLPGAYRRAALPVLERRLADGRLALRDALAELDVRTVELDPWRLANVNAPGDVEAVARRARAIRAAVEVAAAHGVHARRPRILQDWNDTIVHLAPHPIVARVGTSWVAGEKKETYARELAVAAHAAARGGPVVRPSPLLDPGPHERDGVVLAFW
jgi:molybdopterin-guanine dinucleotide biosynthesis protein A